MIKSFKEVIAESTCQKRVTVCEIYDYFGALLSRESNRCSPAGGTCHRLGVVQEKHNYDINSSCNWTHAEVMAIQALPADAKPYRAILMGHRFVCLNCEEALRKAGVKKIHIIPDLPIKIL